MEREREEERDGGREEIRIGEEKKKGKYGKENRKINYYILFTNFVIYFIKRKWYKVHNGSREPSNYRIEFISLRFRFDRFHEFLINIKYTLSHEIFLVFCSRFLNFSRFMSYLR